MRGDPSNFIFIEAVAREFTGNPSPWNSITGVKFIS
jgi:hypothetical protein